jgi:hypothetical protein
MMYGLELWMCGAVELDLVEYLVDFDGALLNQQHQACCIMVCMISPCPRNDDVWHAV